MYVRTNVEFMTGYYPFFQGISKVKKKENKERKRKKAIGSLRKEILYLFRN